MSRHDDHRGISWKALAFYGISSAIVLIVGALALHFFFERQNLKSSLASESLPSVLIVVETADDPLGAAWVKLLTEADFAPSLLTPENFRPTDGVLVLCNLTRTNPSMVGAVAAHKQKGGALVLLGSVPESLRATTGISTEAGTSGTALRIGETVSPILARVHPGQEIGLRPGEAPLLIEAPETIVDARWRESARAVVAHRTDGLSRTVWFGFDPSRLYARGDRHLGLMLRTAFRWAAGQPVSDGAAGSAPAVARALAPSARVESRAMRMGFSIDRLEKPGYFSVRVTNKGNLRLQNPTIKFWLPPGIKRVKLIGSLISRRRVSLVQVEGEGAVLIAFPSLAPNEDRVLRLRATK